jgi:hypothetical protein
VIGIDGRCALTYIMTPVLELPTLTLAQFVKRVTWSAMRECAVDEAECYEIRAAIDKVQRALAEANYAPR